jgi:methylase of polypeptide subunit release factors
VLGAPPVAGRGAALAALGRTLRASGYTPDGLAAALETEGPLVEGVTIGDRRRRARRAGALGVVARLLLLGESVPADECGGPAESIVRSLVDLGLVEARGDDLLATVLVVPHDDLLVASDRIGSDAGADFVPGVQPPSHLLGCLTVRRPVERALDLGTGCGIQALLLSPIAGRVVATDVNERALAFAELNAALNGLTNIEPRVGSLFEPVSGEAFGVLVANPPYVISPEHDFTFRDSELGGQGISEAVVVDAPDYLLPGGHATVLVSWDATDENPVATPARWATRTDCDALVLGTATLDAERNAERWLAYFIAEGITRIGYGAVVIRRVPDGAGRVRALQIGDRVEGPAGTHLLRMLDAGDKLVDEARVRLASGARVRERRGLTQFGWHTDERELVLLDGLRFRIDLDSGTVRLVDLLDGRHRLRAIADDSDEREYVERLVALGFAEVV